MWLTFLLYPINYFLFCATILSITAGTEYLQTLATGWLSACLSQKEKCQALEKLLINLNIICHIISEFLVHPHLLCCSGTPSWSSLNILHLSISLTLLDAWHLPRTQPHGLPRLQRSTVFFGRQANRSAASEWNSSQDSRGSREAPLSMVDKSLRSCTQVEYGLIWRATKWRPLPFSERSWIF